MPANKANAVPREVRPVGLSDDVDEADVPDPVTTPVAGVFGVVQAADDNARATIDVTPDEVWDGEESTRVAYTTISMGAFQFTLHLEGDDARAVAHDLLEAVNEDDG